MSSSPDTFGWKSVKKPTEFDCKKDPPQRPRASQKDITPTPQRPQVSQKISLNKSYSDVPQNKLKDSSETDVTKKQLEIRNYRIGEAIGRGGFGVVLKGIHTETGKIVAIKQIFSVVPKQQVNKEIELLRMLDNTFIVKFYECFVDNESLYIVLEYVEGGSLYQIIKNFGVFPENLAQVYIEQVLMGMEYLHSKNIIHRDIKCGNILITKTGVCKLADFGTGILVSEAKNRLTMVGTPFWMAPEALSSEELTTSVDVWSLGCTLIELLTGNPPYWNLGPMAAMFRISTDDHPPIPAGLSENLQHFLHCCLQKNPNHRYTVTQLLQHPWIARSAVKTRERSLTIMEAQQVLESHNERKFITVGISCYEETLILEKEINDSELSSFLEALDRSPDPKNLLVAFQAEQTAPLEGNVLELFDKFIASSLPTPCESHEEVPLQSKNNKIEENTEENSGESCKNSENEKEKTNEIEELRKHIEFLKMENQQLKGLTKDLHNQLGMVLNEKKKAITIAKRFQQISMNDQVQLKNAIAQLQSVKDTMNKAPDDPELTALREAKQKLRLASRFLVSNLVDTTQLALRVFKGLSANLVRFNGMESWINFRTYPKSWNEKQKNTIKVYRRWVILNSGFLFAYDAFDSESPTDIILLDRCKVIKDTSESDVESEIKLREIITRQSTVEKSVARWLGDEKEEKKKKKPRTSKRESVENRFRGVFCFLLEENENIHQLGCDSGNMLKMWTDACTNYSNWYEDMDFNQQPS